MSTNAACMGSISPQPCPQIPCAGCPRVFIWPEKVVARCPACNGSGQLRCPDDGYGSSTIPLTKTCHGCGGKGWVTP